MNVPGNLTTRRPAAAAEVENPGLSKIVTICARRGSFATTAKPSTQSGRGPRSGGIVKKWLVNCSRRARPASNPRAWDYLLRRIPRAPPLLMWLHLCSRNPSLHPCSRNPSQHLCSWNLSVPPILLDQGYFAAINPFMLDQDHLARIAAFAHAWPTWGDKIRSMETP